MNVLDLFNTVYERALNEGAVDDLEARYIHGLNTKMLDLMARTKEPQYQNNPKALAGLKRQYEKIKDERDSFYKIREAQQGQDIVDRTAKMKALTPSKPGVTGAVKDVAQGLKNFLQGKPETGPTYEAQKKNSEKVEEYISYGSDKNYEEAEPYKNYKIYVRRKPFGTTGMYTAHTEIDRKEFMGKGSSQEQAIAAVRDRIDFVLNAQRKVTGSSTIDFNVKFATDLLADPRQTFYAKLENINGEPKLIIAGQDIASDPELLAAGDFKRSSVRNQVDDEGRATPLPGIPLTAKGLRSGDWIANGRYTVGKETQDRDGNRVFDLTYHSTAHTKSDKLRLNQPAFTLGTAREVDEHGGGIGPSQRWQDLMPEQLNPEDDWYDDEEDQETELRSGDYVRDTMDGEHGEIFRMQGDPYERRVRILDRDGKGWYIEPSRLTRVDPQDPDVQRYFGKQRVRDMDEMDKSQPSQERHGDRALGAKGTAATPVAARKVVKDLAMDLDQAFAKQPPVKKKGVAEEYEPSPVAGAIVRRIMFNHPDLLKQYGPNLVNAAVDNVADYVGDVDEIGSSDVSAWVAQVERMLKENPPEAFDEGWSDAIVARRTGRPRTPYSVYIKGKKWKDFADDDHAEAVANKLRAKFKADGRDPETITIAPTDMTEGLKSTLAGAALAGAMALGGAGAAQAQSAAGGPNIANATTIIQQIQAGKIQNQNDLASALSNASNKQAIFKQLQAKAGLPGHGADSVINALGGKSSAGAQQPIKSAGQSGSIVQKPTDNFEGTAKKAHKITLQPDMDEGIKKSAASAALAACIAAGGTLSGCATNPSVGGTIGTVRDVGTAVKTAQNMTRAGVQDELGQELRNFIRAQGGDPGSQNLSLLYKLQKRMQGKQDQPQAINEIKDTQAVEQAIFKRIMVAHRDMLMKYGPEKIMTAASDVAYDVGDIGEIGSSDVSGWVKQVQYILGAKP